MVGGRSTSDAPHCDRNSASRPFDLCRGALGRSRGGMDVLHEIHHRCAVFARAIRRRPRDPEPRGNSRRTPANGSAPELPYRKLTTWVLYPSTVAPTENPVTNAPPAMAGKPFPLIVFAHGLDSEGFIYDPLLEQWVSRATSWSRRPFRCPHCCTRRRHGQGPSSQPGDMSYVLTQVLTLSEESGNLLSGMIDPKRIAGVGHSLGAMTVLAWTENTCCRDPQGRCRRHHRRYRNQVRPREVLQGPNDTNPCAPRHGGQDDPVPGGKKNPRMPSLNPGESHWST